MCILIVSPLHQNPGAGFEQVALIRSELDSLSECLTNVGSHDNIILALEDLEEKFKACRDKCHVAFKKLGGEQKRQVQRTGELEQQIEQLKQKIDELTAQHSSDGSKRSVFIL